MSSWCYWEVGHVQNNPTSQERVVKLRSWAFVNVLLWCLNCKLPNPFQDAQKSSTLGESTYDAFLKAISGGSRNEKKPWVVTVGGETFNFCILSIGKSMNFFHDSETDRLPQLLLKIQEIQERFFSPNDAQIGKSVKKPLLFEFVTSICYSCCRQTLSQNMQMEHYSIYLIEDCIQETSSSWKHLIFHLATAFYTWILLRDFV